MTFACLMFYVNLKNTNLINVDLLICFTRQLSTQGNVSVLFKILELFHTRSYIPQWLTTY